MQLFYSEVNKSSVYGRNVTYAKQAPGMPVRAKTTVFVLPTKCKSAVAFECIAPSFSHPTP